MKTIKSNGHRIAALMLGLVYMGGTADADGQRPPATGNPLATADQTAVTQTALRILDTPEVKKARALVELRWRAVLHDDPPQEAWQSFESSIDDYVFNYVLKAANNDPNYPRVVHVYTPPHEWRGMHVPGSRWGGDNPDNVYRIIPIDGKAHYRLYGRQFGHGPSNVSYTLVGNYETSKTLNGIENKDIQTERDGTFVITLDPQPANDRRNHIQTKPGAVYLFIRDSLGDWRQPANALTIHRVDPPTAPPISDHEIAERAADIMVDGVPQVYWFVKMVHGTPNVMPDPYRAGSVGGLVSQRNSTAEVRLADDDAFVVTVDPAGAAYYSLVAQNYWFITVDYARFNSTLNNGQVAHNADGTITYVVSIKDPGVHNWIDTGGLHNLLLQLRVQGLPERPQSEPWIKSRMVKLADLRKVLPQDTQWVRAAERAHQLAERLAAYQARMADH